MLMCWWSCWVGGVLGKGRREQGAEPAVATKKLTRMMIYLVCCWCDDMGVDVLAIVLFIADHVAVVVLIIMCWYGCVDTLGTVDELTADRLMLWLYMYWVDDVLMCCCGCLSVVLVWYVWCADAGWWMCWCVDTLMCWCLLTLWSGVGVGGLIECACVEVLMIVLKTVFDRVDMYRVDALCWFVGGVVVLCRSVGAMTMLTCWHELALMTGVLTRITVWICADLCWSLCCRAQHAVGTGCAWPNRVLQLLTIAVRFLSYVLLILF